MSNNIAIIGGGASGMMAGIVASKCGATVTIFEKNTRVGKKLLSTGNGRCNITNDNVLSLDDDGNLLHYHCDDIAFPLCCLREFDHKSLLDFLGNLGVLFRCEEGKYYPYSETAATILDVFRFYCEKNNVKFVTDCNVKKIDDNGNSFMVDGMRFDRVIVACGGMSSPHLGSDGSGYSLLSAFGHKKTKVYPAITQVITDNMYTKPLKGIKCNINATAYVAEKKIRTEYGQVLFTEYGVSGPPIFQLSSCFGTGMSDSYIVLDFMPEYSFSEVCDFLFKIRNNPYMTDMTAEYFLTPIFHKRVAQIIVKSCGISLSNEVKKLSDNTIKKLASQIKKFKLSVIGVKSFANAQVTLGGINVKDFDPKTMASKLKKGLYACGEILDVTGDCGGYNLQWAFSSGFAAGRSAAID